MTKQKQKPILHVQGRLKPWQAVHKAPPPPPPPLISLPTLPPCPMSGCYMEQLLSSKSSPRPPGGLAAAGWVPLGQQLARWVVGTSSAGMALIWRAAAMTPTHTTIQSPLMYLGWSLCTLYTVTRRPGESCRRRLRSLLLSSCDVFRVLITPPLPPPPTHPSPCKFYQRNQYMSAFQ